MRLSEYINWLTRTDIGMAVNPKINDYTHLTPQMLDKRARYLYQCKIRGKKPTK
mgnify:FL=1